MLSFSFSNTIIVPFFTIKKNLAEPDLVVGYLTVHCRQGDEILFVMCFLCCRYYKLFRSRHNCKMCIFKVLPLPRHVYIALLHVTQINRNQTFPIVWCNPISISINQRTWGYKIYRTFISSWISWIKGRRQPKQRSNLTKRQSNLGSLLCLVHKIRWSSCEFFDTLVVFASFYNWLSRVF